MRYNYRMIYLKIKRLLILKIVLTCLILSITVINRRPSLLSSFSYKSERSYKGAGTLPGRFLENYIRNNDSYCNFKYGLPDDFSYGELDLEYTPEMGFDSSYRVLYNVIESRQNFTTTVPLTYATHVTPEFVNYISEVARHWQGSVSVAAFVPDSDADILTKQLIQMCHCLPEMSKVSLHYVFPVNQTPFVQKSLSNVVEQRTCSIPDTSNTVTFRSLNALIYPVNVCRNVARNAAATHFVLVSDVQLIPSDDLASNFLRFAARMKIDTRYLPSRVFVLPVFEVEEFEDVPRNKGELVKAIRSERAVYFHRHVCSHCQKFPGLENWIETVIGEGIKPVLSVKREYPFHRWEPIYIGTRYEPFYNEQLSWEGKQDKMAQMLEMCLIGYRFLILDGAFLVHWPGIKRKSLSSRIRNSWRIPYELKNARQYNNISKNLAYKYSTNPKCRMQ